MKNINKYLYETINKSNRIDDSDFSIAKRYAMSHKKKYKKTESQNKYFSENEKIKIMKDMWDKNGQFYKFVKDKVDSLSKEDINDYLDQCLDDDRCAAEFGEYIAMVIGRHNFDLKQVMKFISTEDLKG